MSNHKPPAHEGRCYHIDCKPGDLARYILTCAAPERAHRMAAFLHERELRGGNREFVVYTGEHNGVPLSVMGTGIGPSATAIAIVEAAHCRSDAVFIRVGTCGALQSNIQLGDLIITDRVIRDENTTHYYAPADMDVSAHPAVRTAIQDAADELGHAYHVGTTCTTSDFYAGQGRMVEGFPTREPGKAERLGRAGVLNFEMEMSVYLTLAQVSEFDLRAGGVTVAVANRVEGTFADPGDLDRFEDRCIRVGLRAAELLSERDRAVSRDRI